MFLRSYMVAYMIGVLLLFPISVATAQRLRRWPALVVGLIGAVVHQGVYLIFIR